MAACLSGRIGLNSSVLASLLPGLRQVRAPIAAGFVWLVTAWLALADFVPHSSEGATGVFRDIYAIAGVAGEAGISASAGFIAYLLGILSVQVSSALFAVPTNIRARRGGRVASLQALPPPSDQGRRALAETVVRELVERSSRDDDLMEMLKQTGIECGARSLKDANVLASMVWVRLNIDRYVDKIVADLPHLPLRLIDDSGRKELFGEFDRRRAEAEFRAAVALPLVGLSVVLAVRVSPWFAFGLVVPAILAVQAHLSAVSAADVLAAAMRAQEPAPASPALDEVRAGPPLERDDWLKYAVKLHYPVAAEVERKQDADAAEPYYREQAEGGDGAAMMWLAGRLHRRSEPGADGWYYRAARAGNNDALAVEALDGTRQVSRDELNAVKSAFAKDRSEMRVAANVLMHTAPNPSGASPDTVPNRRQQAIEWYRTAWKEGDIAAGEKLAEIFDAAGDPHSGARYRRPFRRPAPDIEANGSASDRNGDAALGEG